MVLRPIFPWVVLVTGRSSCHTEQAACWSCLRLHVGREAWLYLWVLQSSFIVYFWHTGHEWYPGYCSHLMLIRVHYSVNNHHVARSVLEDTTWRWETILSSKQCVIIQHTWWKKSKVYDCSHGTTGQKLCKTNHSMQMQCHGTEINLQCTNFQVIFTKHLPTDIIQCRFSLFLWKKTHNTRFHAHQN